MADFEWERRTVADEPRLSELVEMYEELGFEVQLEDFNPKEEGAECTECMKENPEKYKVIYTRKVK